MEELIYWGIILLFYLFSAYRSRQKKQNKEEVFDPQPLTPKTNNSNNPDFNIFEFLNDTMEKSAIDIERIPTNERNTINANVTTSKKKNVEENNIFQEDLEPEYNIKDKHLTHLENRISHGNKKKKSPSKKLKTIQKKLQNKPTKLAIVMQAIFDPPKSQGI